MHVRNLPFRGAGREPEDIMDYCGLSAKHIVQEALGMLELQSA